MTWTPESLARAYELFKIVDFRAMCKTCGKVVPRTFDGNCHRCHVKLYNQLGQPYCPPLP